MTVRELDFGLFPHFCISTANAVIAMKLEYLPSRYIKGTLYRTSYGAFGVVEERI